MLYGFESMVPNSKVVANLNGGAVIDQSDTVAAGMLEAHPGINVMIGINDDTAFGIEAALKAAGDWNADWGIIGTTDGGPPAMAALAGVNTPWKFESGYPPKDFTYAAFNLLNAQVAGKANKNTQVILNYPPIERGPDAGVAQLAVRSRVQGLSSRPGWTLSGATFAETGGRSSRATRCPPRATGVGRRRRSAPVARAFLRNSRQARVRKDR